MEGKGKLGVPAGASTGLMQEPPEIPGSSSTECAGAGDEEVCFTQRERAGATWLPASDRRPGLGAFACRGALVLRQGKPFLGDVV